MAHIRIIHTSDFHDRLTPEKAELLSGLKARHDALLVDTGDAVRALNVTVSLRRERCVDLMNEAGHDVMGLGNREYFFRRWGMDRKTSAAAFPLIAHNLRYADEAAPRPPTVLTTREGVSVGFVALMPTMIAPGTWPERISDTRFVPWQEAAREAVDLLRDSCDTVVALFHRCDREIPELVRLCPEVRLVLAGHSHLLTEKAEVMETGRVVSRVGMHAEHCRVLGLRIPEGTVTMDRLISLDSPEPPEET